jgi:hypothetical protein
METLKEFEALKTKFPRLGQTGVGNENCDWTDHVRSGKNCYWSFDSAEIQDCLYSYFDWKVTSSIDTQWSAFCERCYELSDSIESSDCYFSGYLAQSYDLQYCFRCTSSHDCFGCVNLHNKEFCIFNVQHTEDEYRAKLPELKKMKPDDVLKKLKELTLKFPTIQSNFVDNQNSDYVDYVNKSTNAYYCFDCNILEDCGYMSNSNECKDCWDGTMAFKLEHCCETVDCEECYNCYGTQDSVRCFDSSYLYGCVDCNNCFMCVNLANAKYCILNVQYTPEEYKKKVAEIKQAQNLGYKEPPQA